MLKRFFSFVILILYLVFSNAVADENKYRYEFYDTFDTRIAIIAYTDNKELFDNEMKEVYDIFLKYHRLFDIYNEYDGITNMATVNKLAYQKPVAVDSDLFEFLKYVKQIQEKIKSPANIAMGKVLAIWHDVREVAEKNPDKAYLPDINELKLASEHCNIESLILDETNSSVSYSDDIALDLGSIAKGYACEKAAQHLLNSKIPNFIINAGGNIRAGKSPLDGRKCWGVGIADPFKVNTGESDVYDIVFMKEASLVTSGDYQRYFMYDGQRYHHIIDPITLFPARYHRSVSIYTKDSGIADYLSTALYCMPYQEGMEFIKKLDGVEAMWILNDGSSVASDGFKKIQKSNGASSFSDND